MAQKQNGDKHAGVTTVDKNGVSKTVIVQLEVIDGKVQAKRPEDIGIVR